MHRSKLEALVIDCHENHFEESIAFWSQALGMKPTATSSERYVRLEGNLRPMTILLQKVDREMGVHLDLETDDLQKERARLQRLGAREKRSVKHWVVMEAPGGQRFCVVPTEPGTRLTDGRAWPDEGDGP